jgi:hypothetical protein
MRPRLFIILFFLSGKLVSQDAFREMDRVYGLDQLLFNGEKYTYFLPRGTGGNQYLSSTDFITGEVIIRGKRYEGIPLNYDIYNQQLLLQYADETGASNIIEISKAWLESFSLGNMNFKCLRPEKAPVIYQVLGDGPLYILYHWWKDLKLDNSKGGANFVFAPSKKYQYVLIDDKLHSYGSKRSFISLFDPVHQDEIRNYIKDHRIIMKKASDQAMTGLIEYIGKL